MVVLTALSLEYEAVLSHLDDDVRKRVHEQYGTRAEVARLPGTPWDVALVEMGEGARTAAVLTERVVTWLNPQAVIFVGVAGSLKKDIPVGDVVIATKVYGIHGGKETTEGFLVRPEAWHASHRLEQAARHALRRDQHVHFKPIATGDVVLASARSALMEDLRTHYNDAAAIEMEGAGVVDAVDLAGGDALVIRGISDRANAAKSRKDEEGWQPRAAENAAAAAVAVLRELMPFRGRSGGDADDSEEGPHQGASYGGDHLDFRGSTFNGPFVAKRVDRER